jgi:hypothetical protein
MRHVLAAALAAGWAITACGYPFGPCHTERIEAIQTATLDRGAGPVTWDGAGIVAPGNTSDFDALREFLIDGRMLGGRRVVWTVNTSTGYVAVFLPGSVEAGDQVAVSGVNGGGWGVMAGSAGASISVRDGDFQGTAATGSISVLEVAPLRVRIEVVVSDGDGSSRILSALTGFTYARQRVACD